MSSCRRVSIFTLFLLASYCLLLTAPAFADGPQWWTDRGVINANTPDNYAAVNLGQLKNIASAAYAECISKGLPQNTEYDALTAVLNPWLNEDPPVNYAAANVGQVKHIGSLFHAWLAAAGYPTPMTFTAHPDDYSAANIGQVKNIFNFDLTGFATPSTTYADVNNLNPVFPYDTWAKAANTIQAAVDAVMLGGTVIVAEGIYNTGGKIGTTDPENQLMNRIYVPQGVTVQAFGARELTIIEGAPDPITLGLGDNAVRGVYLEANAVIQGFTVRGGRTSRQYGASGNGGGVCTAGSVAMVADCTIISNFANNNGGGVNSASCVTNSLIVNNGCFGLGGGLYNSAVLNSGIKNNSALYGGGVCTGTAKNCLIVKNTAVSNGGGISFSSIASCTVVENSAGISGGGAEVANVDNSIVYNNFAPTDPNYVDSTFFNFSCTTPLPAGDGNISADPQFLDAVNGDYRLKNWSPCIDAGQNETWMDGATDLSGVTRKIDARQDGDATVDMGAYEFDGVALVWGPDLYVNQANPNPQEPYSTPETAAAVIQDALDLAGPGMTVHVAPGVYNTGGRMSDNPENQLMNRVYVPQGVTVQSLSGPEFTIIEGAPDPSTGGLGDNAVRGVYLEDGAMLNGLTVRGGFTKSSSGTWQQDEMGGGVYCAGGSSFVTNCTISSNTAVLGGGMGGMAYGSAVNCTISGNTAYEGGGLFGCSSVVNCTISSNTAEFYGGGMVSGTAANCMISGNTAYYGGGMMFGSVANCTISGNTAYEGGGMISGTAVNCTIVNNTATTGCGGISYSSSKNCIVYNNTAPTFANYDSSCTITYSCSTPLPAGTGNIDRNPQFVDPANGDYRLNDNSPCIDTGLNEAWMYSANDLDGYARIANVTVDMGAYEYGSSVISWALFPAIPLKSWNGSAGDVVMSATVALDYYIGGWDHFFLSSINGVAGGWPSAVGLSIRVNGADYNLSAEDSVKVSNAITAGESVNLIELIYTGGGQIYLPAPIYGLHWKPTLIMR